MKNQLHTMIYQVNNHKEQTEPITDIPIMAICMLIIQFIVHRTITDSKYEIRDFEDDRVNFFCECFKMEH